MNVDIPPNYANTGYDSGPMNTTIDVHLDETRHNIEEMTVSMANMKLLHKQERKAILKAEKNYTAVAMDKEVHVKESRRQL